MSVQNALYFIQKVGEDDRLKEKIRVMGSNVGLQDMVKMGAEMGLGFSVNELRIAFSKDWAMRYFFYAERNSK